MYQISQEKVSCILDIDYVDIIVFSYKVPKSKWDYQFQMEGMKDRLIAAVGYHNKPHLARLNLMPASLGSG